MKILLIKARYSTTKTIFYPTVTKLNMNHLSIRII